MLNIFNVVCFFSSFTKYLLLSSILCTFLFFSKQLNWHLMCRFRPSGFFFPSVKYYMPPGCAAILKKPYFICCQFVYQKVTCNWSMIFTLLSVKSAKSFTMLLVNLGSWCYVGLPSLDLRKYVEAAMDISLASMYKNYIPHWRCPPAPRFFLPMSQLTLKSRSQLSSLSRKLSCGRVSLPPHFG